MGSESPGAKKTPSKILSVFGQASNPNRLIECPIPYPLCHCALFTSTAEARKIWSPERFMEIQIEGGSTEGIIHLMEFKIGLGERSI